MGGPLSFIDNIGWSEMLLVALVSILVFGKRLPEVAGQAAHQVKKMRRALDDMRRESGIDQEIAEVERSLREIEREAQEATRPLRAPHEMLVPRSAIYPSGVPGSAPTAPAAAEPLEPAASRSKPSASREAPPPPPVPPATPSVP
jgi:Sec-independent protein translocase protein TatA